MLERESRKKDPDTHSHRLLPLYSGITASNFAGILQAKIGKD